VGRASKRLCLIQECPRQHRQIPLPGSTHFVRLRIRRRESRLFRRLFHPQRTHRRESRPFRRQFRPRRARQQPLNPPQINPLKSHRCRQVKGPLKSHRCRQVKGPLKSHRCRQVKGPLKSHRCRQVKGLLKNHRCRQVKGLHQCLQMLLVGLQLTHQRQKGPPVNRALFLRSLRPKTPLRVQLHLLDQLPWCGRARRQHHRHIQQPARRRFQRGVQANRLHSHPRLARLPSQRKVRMLMFRVSLSHCRFGRTRRFLPLPRPDPRRQTFRFRRTMCQLR